MTSARKNSLPAFPPARRRMTLAMGAMVLSAACWGCALVMTKGALAQIPPFTLLAIQLASSVTLLWMAVAVMGVRTGLGAGNLRAAATGIFEPGLAYGLSVPGLALTNATNASIIGAAEPALIILIAWVFLCQRPTARLTLALLLAVIGIILLTSINLEGSRGSDLRGDLLVLLGTACAACYVVASSRFVASISPLPLAAMQQTIGLGFALSLLAGALLLGAEALPAKIALTTILLAIVSGIVQYALAFWFYLIGLTALEPGTAGLFLALIPVFGICSAALFLGESPVAVQVIGAVLVIVALIIAARPPV